MLSEKTQKNVLKGLVCVTVAGQVISIPINTSAKTIDVNSVCIQESKDYSIDDFVVIGRNIIACGNEYIDSYLKCKDLDRLTTPFLPTNSTANNVLERVSLKSGKVLQRRIYDENGNAKLDIDFNSHGATNSSAYKIHKHEWENGKRGPAKTLTMHEKITHVMIPRGYTDYDEVAKSDEKQIVNLTYDNFKNLLIKNHEITFELNGSDYKIAYAKAKDGNVKYFLTRFNRNILMGVIEQECYYSKGEILQNKMFYGKTLEEIWDKVIVREIY